MLVNQHAKPYEIPAPPLDVQVFDAPGAYEWTQPADLGGYLPYELVKFIVIGAGAGGDSPWATLSAGRGGGSGGRLVRWLTMDYMLGLRAGDVPVEVYVGAAGLGGFVESGDGPVYGAPGEASSITIGTWLASGIERNYQWSGTGGLSNAGSYAGGGAVEEVRPADLTEDNFPFPGSDTRGAAGGLPGNSTSLDGKWGTPSTVTAPELASDGDTGGGGGGYCNGITFGIGGGSQGATMPGFPGSAGYNNYPGPEVMYLSGGGGGGSGGDPVKPNDAGGDGGAGQSPGGGGGGGGKARGSEPDGNGGSGASGMVVIVSSAMRDPDE